MWINNNNSLLSYIIYHNKELLLYYILYESKTGSVYNINSLYSILYLSSNIQIQWKIAAEIEQRQFSNNFKISFSAAKLPLKCWCITRLIT